MNRNASKLVVLNLEESVIAALAKLAPDASLPVAGKLVASKDLQAQLQGHVDTINALNDARAKVSQLVARDQSQRAGIAPVLTGIRNYAAGLYGELSPEFASFGFKARRAAPRTAQSRADAAAKLRATRAARHTMGKRQRAAIHGAPDSPPNSPAIAVAPVSPPPVVTPPVTVAPAQPAPPVAPVTPAVTAGTSSAPIVSSVTNGAAH